MRVARSRRSCGRRWPAAAPHDRPRSWPPTSTAWVAETAFGKIWSREALPLRDRSLITVAMLAALGRTGELRGHLAGARNLGISQEELVEVLMQVAVYAGVPAANDALNVAAEVFDITV